jgi:glycosyltransferase involved in cell wall biosynthesis
MPLSGALVSVIIPVFNGKRFLADAIHSALSQDYRPIEVIIVDDGSSDGSTRLAAAYEDVRVIAQTHAGVAAARNRGIQAARGAFVAFLDQDDVWAPQKLRLQVAALLDHPEAGYAQCGVEVCPEPGFGWPVWVRKETAGAGGLVCLPSTWLVRRSVFACVGLFDTSYRTGCDTDWLVRAREAGVSRIVVPEMLVRWRIHGANASRRLLADRTEGFRVLREAIRRKRLGGRPEA